MRDVRARRAKSHGLVIRNLRRAAELAVANPITLLLLLRITETSPVDEIRRHADYSRSLLRSSSLCTQLKD